MTGSADYQESAIGGPSLQRSEVDYFKKVEEFVDCALEEMKDAVAAYLKVLVDAIRDMDPKFPL